MTLCKPGCVPSAPSNYWTGNNCDIFTRPGGIPRAAFLKCDPAMVLPYEGGWLNLDNIRWAFCNGYLLISGKLVGQKPKGSKTTKRISSCDPEKVVAGSQTITVLDYNADEEELEEFNFWDHIDKYQEYYLLSWMTCDDLWFMYDGAWSADINYVGDDSNEGSAYFDNTFTMNTKNIIKPIKVPGLMGLINSLSSAECYS